MEDFANLSWRVKDVSVLDIGTKFISEENIAKSYVFANSFKPSNQDPDAKKEPKSKLLHYPHSSRLNVNQQAICLRALQLLQIDRSTPFTSSEQQTINTYNNLKIQIHEENGLFLKYVEKEWNRELHKRFSKKILKRVFDFGYSKWKNKLESIKKYDELYKLENMVPISEMDNVEIVHEGCLLELGYVAKVTPPNLNTNVKIILNKIPSIKNMEPKEEVLKCIKLPASQDCHAEQLAKQYGCDVVITSSGLKTIIDNFGPDYNSSWDIPVIVKECEINGSKKNIIFVDKPLPQRVMSRMELNMKCRKVLLQTNMCLSEAHRFNIPQMRSKNSDDDVVDKKRQGSEEITESSLPKQPKQIIQLNEHIASSSVNDSITDMSELGSDNASDVTNGSCDTHGFRVRTEKQRRIQMHHNVTYRMWRLKTKENKNILLKGSSVKKDINILTRCKTDGYEVGENGVFSPVTLVPKLEFQWEYGGELVTKSEVLRQWTTLYFRPFSRLLRVRMKGTNQEYIKIENILLNKIVSEALKHYNCTPMLHLGVLYNVLSNLINLKPGNYLLHHTPKHGPFVALMKSVQQSTSDTLNLHNVYSEQNCKIESTVKWNSIDTTLILPYHIKNGLMPGMFPPHQMCKSQTKIYGLQVNEHNTMKYD
ncbi:hypothetical protein CBL_00845 [Carabus blaptoides fortunei]